MLSLGDLQVFVHHPSRVPLQQLLAAVLSLSHARRN
jgi:hypothetical protein